MSGFDDMVSALKREFRTFRLVPKDRSPLMKVLYYTLGMFLWCPDFLTSYTTVLLTRVYMPPGLIGTHAGVRVLRHERVHMRDCFRTGVLPFALTYLFLLPAVLTLRSVWEMRAYAETMRVEHEETGAVSEATLSHIERQFTSSAYFWMCPFPCLVRRWVRRVRDRIAQSATN
jgi:hypothetical protein